MCKVVELVVGVDVYEGCVVDIFDVDDEVIGLYWIGC